MESLDDGKIIDLYFLRDEDAISETSLKYGLKLRTLSNSIVCNMDDAKKCENDTYLSAWKSIPPNNPASYFFAYLAKIVRNISLNFYKKQKAIKRKAIEEKSMYLQ